MYNQLSNELINFTWILSIVALVIIGRYRFKGMKKIKNKIEEIDDENMKKTLEITYDAIKLFSNILFYLMGIIYILALLISKQVNTLW